MDQQQIGKFMAELRKEKEMTQEQFAEKLGVSNRSVSRWETGRCMPDLSLLSFISEELGVSVSELLNGRRMTTEEMIALRDSINGVIELSNQEKEKKTKKINIFLLIGIICLAIVFLHHQFDVLSLVFKEGATGVVIGILTGLGLLFEVLGFYNNNFHEQSSKIRAKRKKIKRCPKCFTIIENKERCPVCDTCLEYTAELLKVDDQGKIPVRRKLIKIWYLYRELLFLCVVLLFQVWAVYRKTENWIVFGIGLFFFVAGSRWLGEKLFKKKRHLRKYLLISSVLLLFGQWYLNPINYRTDSVTITQRDDSLKVISSVAISEKEQVEQIVEFLKNVKKTGIRNTITRYGYGYTKPAGSEYLVWLDKTRFSIYMVPGNESSVCVSVALPFDFELYNESYCLSKEDSKVFLKLFEEADPNDNSFYMSDSLSYIVLGEHSVEVPEGDEKNDSKENIPDKFSTLPEYEYTAEELMCENVYGLMWKPKKEGEMPLIIYAHGFNGDHADGGGYAQVFAKHGIATYCLDFVGGKRHSYSGGDIMDMSPVTEAKDLIKVLETAKTWDFVDQDKIYVFGESLGGLAAVLAAGEQPELMDRLILLYPALDEIAIGKAVFGAEEFIPNEIPISNNLSIGKRFYADLLDIDLEKEIKKFKKPVFLAHGTMDEVVHVQASREAAELYKEVVYCEYEDQGHGFDERGTKRLMNDIYDFLFD